MKRKITSVFLAILLIFTINNYCKAATASIQCNDSVEINTPITITVTGSAVQWNLNLKVNGQSIATNNELDNVDGNKSISFSGKYTPTSEGNLTVTLEGSVTDANDGSTIKNFNSKTISVTKNNIKDNSNVGGQSENTSNKTTTTTQKSSNANVKMIETSPVDFSGFKSNKTEGYEIDVENSVDRISVNVTKEDSKATVALLNKTNSDTGKSWVYIAEGKNEINVTVTSEDGKNKKTYTINVNRKEAKIEEKIEEPIVEVFGLSELKIEGYELDSQFQTDVYEYKINFKENVDKFNITATATDLEANVEITGNENFTDGENIITIVIKGKTDDKVSTYQIIANKIVTNTETTTGNEIQNNVDNEILVNIEADHKNMISQLIRQITIIIILIIIVIVAFIIKKSKVNDKQYISYQNILDEGSEGKQKEDQKDDYTVKQKRKSSKGRRYK